MRRSVAVLVLALLAPLANAATFVSIGINVGAYPRLVAVPGLPVYYAPDVATNYFFYDGLFWAFDGNAWYDSPWYNGPWLAVQPAFVPMYVLRVPVTYYRRPPPYFVAWDRHAPPHWGEHWGPQWEQDRHGWNQWNPKQSPPRAPLPNYQRRYSGSHYPHADTDQRTLREQHYKYAPREEVTRERWQAPSDHAREAHDAHRQ